jgi:hypothetical protein
VHKNEQQIRTLLKAASILTRKEILSSSYDCCGSSAGRTRDTLTRRWASQKTVTRWPPGVIEWLSSSKRIRASGSSDTARYEMKTLGHRKRHEPRKLGPLRPSNKCQSPVGCFPSLHKAGIDILVHIVDVLISIADLLLERLCNDLGQVVVECSTPVFTQPVEHIWRFLIHISGNLHKSTHAQSSHHMVSTGYGTWCRHVINPGEHTAIPQSKSLSDSRGSVPVTISNKETPKDQRSVGNEARSGSCSIIT